MKKSIAQKWIKALRSGKYVQGKRGEMADRNGGYCCLGVLREVCGTEGLGTDIDDIVLSEHLSLSLRHEEGSIEGTGLSLAKLNDFGISIYDDEKRLLQGSDERFTFEEIADVIEFEYENL